MALCLAMAQGASSASSSGAGDTCLLQRPSPVIQAWPRWNVAGLRQASKQAQLSPCEHLTDADPSSIIFSNLIMGFLSVFPAPLSLNGHPGTIRLFSPGLKLPHVPEEVPDEFKQWHRLTPAQKHDMYCRAEFSLKLNPEASKVIQADPEFATASIIRLLYKKLGVRLDKEFMGRCGIVNPYNHFASIHLPIAQNSVLTIGPFISRVQISFVLPDQKLCLTQLLIKADDGSYGFDLTSEHLAPFAREISKSLGFEKECELNLADTRSVSGVGRFSRTARELVLYSFTENGAFVVKIKAPEARGVFTRVFSESDDRDRDKRVQQPLVWGLRATLVGLMSMTSRMPKMLLGKDVVG